jgi:hypothetical protein
MIKLRTRRKTAFVPRIVFRVAVAGGGTVVPLCVTLALSAGAPGCGGGTVLVVADACFADVSPCSRQDGSRHYDGVADIAFSDGRHDASDGMFTVAADAFGVADIGFSDSPADGPLGVALDAFGGG